MKKLVSLILAIMMIAAVGAAFAVEPLTDGVHDETHNTATTADNSVLILKELVLHNTDGSAIYLPTVDYSYTITEATVASGTTVNDGTVTAVVYADDTTSRALQTTSATVSFSPSTKDGYDSTGTAATITQPMAATSAGAAVYGGFTISFNPANFDHAGVFRYVITESSTNRTTAGVTTGTNTSATRYLDVYVRAIDTSDPADGVYDSFAIYGYVCFTTNGSITTSSTQGKTNGYVEGTSVTDVADQYYTKNLEVKKTFGTSPLNQTGHQFPFTVTLSSGTNGIGAWLNAADTTGAMTTGFTDTHVVLASSNTIVAGLSNNQVLELYGIPTEANATVTVKEMNDTYDVYALTATVANSSVTDISDVNGNVAAQMDSSTTVSVAIDQATKTAITFNNNLQEISPTGVVTRFAPYALILIGGVALLVIAMKRRKHTEED